MTYLSELEARVNRMEAVLCDPTRPGDLDTGGEFSVDVGQIEDLFDAFVDMTAAALACDATRIVTLDVTKMVVNDGGDIFGMGDSENADSAGRDNWHFQAHQWDDNARRWLGLGVAVQPQPAARPARAARSAHGAGLACSGSTAGKSSYSSPTASL